MNLTSNFDIAVELGIDSVTEIFHLAFKNEALFPHNIGPISANIFGEAVNVSITVLDDDTNPAGLTFQDQHRILFTIPFQMAVQVPSAPDPSLSEVNLDAIVAIPGLLNSWNDDSGNPVLGIDFTQVTTADIQVPTLTGVPTVDIGNIVAALHTKYKALAHTYTLSGNTLNIYDDTADPSLNPVNPYTGSTGDIQASEVTVGATQYLKVVLPIAVNVTQPVSYTSPGHITFYREMVQTATSITIDFGSEPGDAAYKTTVVLDNNSIPILTTDVENALQPLAVQAISGFGTQTQLVPNQADAVAAVKEQAAAYISKLKYGIYTPQPGQNQIQLTTPVGFLLVAEGVLAILMNRRDSSVADFPPDNFLAGGQLAMAVGQAKVQELIDAAIAQQFPQLSSGGAPISTPQGHGTLTSLTIHPEDSGDNGATPGHLWTTGSATVHIPCWFDSHVNFSGPIFIDTTLTETSSACELSFQARAGHFSIGQSCCTVFEDLLVPIVGWIVLAVTQSMISSVGGSLASQIAAGQTGIVHPIPPVVTGIAQISACLTSLNIFSDGFVFPGTVTIVRLTTSFQDLQSINRLPRFM